MKTPILDVFFFQTDSGYEPVKKWLQQLNSRDKKLLGEDLKTVQFGWPLGMPLVKHIEGEIWELRSKISGGISRVFFVLDKNSIILIHAFMKKQQRTPKQDLDLVRARVKQLRK